MKAKYYIMLLILSFPIYIQALDLSMTGLIYRKGSDRQDLLYRQEEYRKVTSLGKMIEHRYLNKDGSLAAFEAVEFLNGSIERYDTEIKEIAFKGSLVESDDRLILMRDIDGKKRTRSLRSRDNVIVGPVLPDFIGKNLNLLEKGEIVQFYLPYFDFLTLVPMELKLKEKDTDYAVGNDAVIIEMSLKSAFLSLFIDPIDLIVDKESGKVIEIHGQTILPDPGVGDTTKLVFADIYYLYGEKL